MTKKTRRHRQVNGNLGRGATSFGPDERQATALVLEISRQTAKPGHAKRGGLQPLQILDKGYERGSRLDREPTGTVALAGLI